MSSRNSLSAGFPAISSRAEVLQLESSRATPAPEYNLTPDRSTALAVNSQTEAANESRLALLKARLDRSGHEMRTEQAISRLDGHARVDFDQCR